MKKLLTLIAIVVAAIITLPALGFALVLMLAALAVGLFGMIFSIILSIKRAKSKPIKQDFYQPEKELGI